MNQFKKIAELLGFKLWGKKHTPINDKNATVKKSLLVEENKHLSERCSLLEEQVTIYSNYYDIKGYDDPYVHRNNWDDDYSKPRSWKEWDNGDV